MDDLLKLDKQLCFSVYVLHREIMQQYRTILEEIDLTYPQYITMMALWENDEQTVNQLGAKLFLDNGTLTPLLKRLEAKVLLTRTRSKEDERVVKIQLTAQGLQLKEKASCIPMQIFEALKLDYTDMVQLKALAEKIVDNVGNS
ncbi:MULTISPECIES: MarR family winged helix-turn-helix transcriptional regulator [Sphingobacterium]|jgi:DNA-binding MarR family transcriptional regulator|uniref:Organic hydroperoxide resistance transcriptional regulator n=1 Tax=Sphingobacterium multivorum TaxID=28454 RepID=A0A2X2INC3_SPHMU|nr:MULTISPECIES: MarR family transcriptional regulator [Sphingobacterium]OJZ15050.1 MAG: MarR family transcriptional regulator [Sphingobacterium sp. 40-24]QQT44501.1 MarR family transcriptional regulator [Sphingobacterium multivorum]QQT62769.1 MarR family transcriptional regulator [Sphingobacterium multivorum]QRQ62075.1 MarR family transcriptional regulator [Sphingobacterium multivorum]SPZ83747.1 Organic hydroperoxide resistance transcriptional regulator [Sphingobacterium multivorum]